MDPIREWSEARDRVIGLVTAASEEELARTVPATPAWTVRELVAHMIGLDADILAGNQPDDHGEQWTAAQVEARRDDDVQTLVDEWQSLSEPLVTWMRRNGARPMGDVVIHEQDLRGALGRSGFQDTAGLEAVRDRMAVGFQQRVAADGGATVELVGPGWSFVAGDGPNNIRIEAPDFDLARALMSRRSAAQLRSWAVTGYAESVLPLFEGLGPLPLQDLSE